MKTARHLVAALLLLPFAGRARAQTVLDLVPADATAGIAIRNLDELAKRGDEFVNAAEMQNIFRPSQLWLMALQFLGVNGGVDLKNSAAVVLVPPEKGQDAMNLPNLDRLLVVILPFTDLDALSANFGFEKGQLKPGKIQAGKGTNFGQIFYARGKHLYIANSKYAVSRVLESKAGRKELSAEQKKAVNDSDLFIHVNPRSMGKEWDSFIDNLRREFGKLDDAAEQQVIEQFLDALGDVRYGLGTLRVDRGLGVSLLAVLGNEKKGGREFLKALGSSSAAASLKGLPDGNVLAIQASQGDGRKTGVIAKVLFDWVLKTLVQDRRILAAVDQPVVVGVFTEVWTRLRGSRLALYKNPAESEQGLMSGVAILDTDDAGKFLADLRILARIADGKGLELNPKEKSKPAVDIEQLIRDLGDRQFHVRESASLKLRLLGEASQPLLDKARRSVELEVARRADRLYRQIAEGAAARRKELLSADVLRSIRPTFAYIAEAEKRQGHTVDVVRIQLAERDVPRAKPFMQQLLGPEWHNLRLVPRGKQVIAFFGSDLDLLNETLKNLAADKPGLEASAAVKAFQRQAQPSRKIELHLAMASLLALIDPTGARAPGRAVVSSVGLSVGADYLRLDIWVPSQEFSVIARRNGL